MLRRLVSFYTLQFRLLWQWKPGRRALARRLIVTFLVAWVSFAATILLLPGISAQDQGQIVAAVIALALLNALVRPIFLALLAPVSIVLVGIATLVFQVVAILVVGTITGIRVDGPVTAFVGSWVYAILDTALTAIFSIDRDESYWGALVRGLTARRRDVVRTDRPGVVIIQLDGVAHPILAHQIRAGRVPTIARWVRHRTMRLDRWTALLPTQTSAAQAGILHGRNDFIPAFRWWDKRRQRLIVSNRPSDAAEIAARASDGHGLLSADGASIGNLVHGDAARSYMTLSTVGRGGGFGQSDAFYHFFVSPYNYLHTIVLTLGEVLKELVQARRAARRGIEPIHSRGFPYPLARAATNVALRALSTSLVLEEMYRGTPVIYVDYTDYDEVAHFSGPERAEALDALDGIDSTLRSLEKAARDTPRPYRFVLLSDHGQSLGATFRQRFKASLRDVVVELMGAGSATVAVAGELAGPAEPYGALSAAVTEASLTPGATGAVTRATFRRRMTDGQVDLTPRDRRPAARDAAASSSAAKQAPPEVVVCPSGNLAHIYFPRLEGRVTLEALSRRWPGLVPGLAGQPGIGLVLVRSERHGAVVFGSAGTAYLDEERIEGDDPLIGYGDQAAAGLRRLDGMEDCGDLAVISLHDPTTDEVAAFEELIGSHGGLGGPQSEPFLLHPAEWEVDEPLVGAEAVHRQLRTWLDAIGIELGAAPEAEVREADARPAPPPGVAAAVEPGG
jgi:uncharacterized membrane protein YvlD (DUF360 family)